MKVAADHVTIPKEGEKENGDAAIVRETPDGVLFAVIDALGHGPAAAAVARMAMDHLLEAELDRGVERVVMGLHERLRGSRGAAAMVCLVRGDNLDGCGVGNVDLRSLGTRISSVLTAGILGGTLKRPRVFEAKLRAGDRVVLFSDGISSRFDLDASRAHPPSEACRAIMRQNRRTYDDSTVLVVDLEV